VYRIGGGPNATPQDLISRTFKDAGDYSRWLNIVRITSGNIERNGRLGRRAELSIPARIELLWSSRGEEASLFFKVDGFGGSSWAPREDP